MAAKLTVSSARSTIGGRAEQQDASEHVQRKRRGVLVVCDGVGSSPRARECAELTARTALEYLSALDVRARRTPELLHRLPDTLVDMLTSAAVTGAVHPQSATTLAAAVLDDQFCWTLTVGDSRVLLVRDGSIAAATRVDTGVAAQADGRVGRGGPALERWIAASASTEERVATVESWRLQPGDTVVLVTDGVTAVVAPWELARLVDFALHTGRDISRTVIDTVIERAAQDADNATVTAATVPATRRTP